MTDKPHFWEDDGLIPASSQGPRATGNLIIWLLKLIESRWMNSRSCQRCRRLSIFVASRTWSACDGDATRCDAMRSMEALPFLCLPTRPLLCFALLAHSSVGLGRVLRHVWRSSARFSFAHISANLLASRRPPRSRSRRSLARGLARTTDNRRLDDQTSPGPALAHI